MYVVSLVCFDCYCFYVLFHLHFICYLIIFFAYILSLPFSELRLVRLALDVVD